MFHIIDLSTNKTVFSDSNDFVCVDWAINHYSNRNKWDLKGDVEWMKKQKKNN